MIVVDTNVLAYFLLPYDDFSVAADALFKRDAEWAAPILWRSEFRNLLAGELRRKNLSFEEIVKVQSEAETLLAGNEHEVDSRRVLELVRDSNCTAYDCEFIALGLQLGVNVVTMDAKLIKAFPRHAKALVAA